MNGPGPATAPTFSFYPAQQCRLDFLGIKHLKLLSIAFVACNKNPTLYRQDPSFIYRCENLGLALRTLGYEVKFLHYTELKLSEPSQIIVFHRPNHKLFLALKLQRMAKKGRILVADVDDLIFHPDWAEFSPGVRNQIVSKRVTEAAFKKNLMALQLFQYISVSTTELQQRLKDVVPQANSLVLHNAVHLHWYATKPELAPEIINPCIISYWPGTRSHDRDFQQITAPLEQIFAEYPHLKLMITGPLNANLQLASGQLIKAEKVPFPSYHDVVMQSHINLLPLEQTFFNQHKSALKVIEASYFGIPTLSSALPDLTHLPSHSYQVMHNEHDWYNSLKNLVTQPIRRANVYHCPEQPSVLSYARVFINWLQPDENTAYV
jgi:hypothetical protein